MFDELPPYTGVFRALIGELYDDLPGRVERLRELLALDADFGGGGVLLPGGHPTYLAYTEARSSYVAGNFVATILLCQAMIEHLLGGHLVVDDVTRSIRQLPSREEIDQRPALDKILKECVARGLLNSKDESDIRRLTSLRNPLIHFRQIDDPTHIERRSMSSGDHAFDLVAQDARFAIATSLRLLNKTEFAMGRTR